MTMVDRRTTPNEGGREWSVAVAAGVSLAAITMVLAPIPIVILAAGAAVAASVAMACRRPPGGGKAEVGGDRVGAPLAYHDRVTLWVVRLFPVTVALAAQDRNASLAGLAVLALLALLALTKAHRVETEVPRVGWELAVVAVVAELAWVVHPPTRWVTFVLAAFGTIAWALSRLSPETRHSAVGAAHDGIGIFLIVSALLYYGAGLRSAADSARLHQVLSAAHVFGTRVTFPLSSGITTPPALAAVFLAGLAAYRRPFRGGRGFFQLGAASVAVVVLLASNGRAAIAVTLAVVAAALWARPAMIRLAPWACVFALCMPLVVQTISSSAAPVLSSVVPFFDRGVAGSEADTFGGRTPIWKTAIRVYAQEPPLRKMLGYGAAGHITSGAAPRYVRYLRGFLRHPDQGHPHSTALQVLFDSGALGLGALLLLVFRTLRRLGAVSNGSDHPGSAAAQAACVAMLLALACTASTDPLLAPGPSLETFWVFMTVCACAALIRAPARDRDRTGIPVPAA